MATDLKLPDHVIEGLIKSAIDDAAIFKVADVRQVSARRDSVVHSFNASPAKFHNPKYSEGDKEVSDDTIDTVEIAMSTLYKLLEFYDFEAEDMPGLIDEIKNTLPAVIRATFDLNAVGGTALVPTSRFTGYTTPSVTVDETAASWEAVLDSITEKGHSANAIILDTRFKPAFKKAVVEGTNSSALMLQVGEGFNLGDVPVYFRKLGANVGLAGDFSQAVVAYHGGIDLELHKPSDNYELRVRNMTAIYAGLRIGYAVRDQNAFQPFTLATAGE